MLVNSGGSTILHDVKNSILSKHTPAGLNIFCILTNVAWIDGSSNKMMDQIRRGRGMLKAMKENKF